MHCETRLSHTPKGRAFFATYFPTTWGGKTLPYETARGAARALPLTQRTTLPGSNKLTSNDSAISSGPETGYVTHS